MGAPVRMGEQSGFMSEIAINYGESTSSPSPTNEARVFISSVRASQLICDGDDTKSTVNLNKLHSNIDVLPIN